MLLLNGNALNQCHSVHNIFMAKNMVIAKKTIRRNVQVTMAAKHHAVVKEVAMLLLNGNALNQCHSVHNIFMAKNMVVAKKILMVPVISPGVKSRAKKIVNILMDAELM